MEAKYFVWAGHEVNRKRGDQHYLVVGASGSGKSTLINHVMQSVITDPGVRALVYDPKQELVPFLFGVRGAGQVRGRAQSSIKLLHPFDSRGMAWNMAADIDNPISARQLATILVPDGESGSSDGFFTNAVRDILAGAILAFVECVPNKDSWTFRDVLLTLLYEPYIDFIFGLKSDRYGQDFPTLHRLRESYFGPSVDARTKANIRASLNTRLAVFEPVAAAWHQAETSSDFGGYFSLKQWLEEVPGPGKPGSILVLGNDEAARAALDPINQALFKRATELVLARKERTADQRESGDNQIWFFLDEVREAGKLDGLGRLLTKGRSKNVCVTMGFQDIDGMREVYGKEVANEICAQFNNIAVLRVNSPETADWASSLFGKRIEQSRNTSTGVSGGEKGGVSVNTGRSEEERPFFHTDTFLYGTNAAASKSVVGHRKGPDIEVTGLPREQARERFAFAEKSEAPRVSTETLANHFNNLRIGRTPEESAQLASEFVPRPPAHQYLRPWTRDDFDRLGFNEKVPDWKQVKEANKSGQTQSEAEQRKAAELEQEQKAKAKKKEGERPSIKGWMHAPSEPEQD